MSATFSPSNTRDIIIGSILVALCQLFIGTNDAIVKSCGLGESQILFSRYSIQLCLAIIWWNFRKDKPMHFNWYGDTPYIPNVWLRGFTYFMAILTGYFTIYRLPLGDAFCIFYQAPIWTVFIARIYLKEQLPNLWVLIPSVLLTSSGIVLITQPHFLFSMLSIKYYESLNIIGVIVACVSSLCWVFSSILVRTAVKAHFLQIELVSSIQAVLIWTPLFTLIDFLWIHEDTFNGNGWIFDGNAIISMFCVGVFGFVGMALFVMGYQYGDATKVAWLEYINIIITMLYQTFLFNDIPNVYELCGTIMVFIGSILPLFHECFKKYHQQIVPYQAVDMDSEFLYDEEENEQENKDAVAI
eukprot:187063_1